MSSVLHKLLMQAFSSLFFFLLLFFLVKWLSNSSSKHKNLPPSPPKLPILGHLRLLGMYPHRSLQSLSKQYGEIMLMYLGQKPTLIVSSASVAKEILKTHDAIISNRPKSSINDRLLYNSRDVSAAPYGEYWRQMKSLLTLQLASNRRVRTFRALREEETAFLVEKIRKSTSAVNLSEMFSILTNDLTCRVAFGRKYSGEQHREFKELLEELMRLLGVCNVGDFIPWLAWINRFNGLNVRLHKAAKKLDVLFEEIINEHLDQSKRQDCCASADGNIDMDFVDALLEVQRNNTLGFPIERDNIKALILNAFAAGTHTTSTVLEWAMSEIIKNPRVMTELQKEVRGISRGKEVITEDDLEDMKYLKAVMKETLRLHPPIPLLVPRETTQELKINGYDIDAVTTVIINAWAIQRDAITWDEPEEFRPERFLNSALDFKGQDFQLLPFGGGRRICPGISFAVANNELVLANLVHNFNWSLPDGATCETLDMSESIGLTIQRNAPLLATATPRPYQ